MTFKLVYCLLVLVASTFCAPYSKKHYGDYESAIFPQNLSVKETTARSGMCAGAVGSWTSKPKMDNKEINNYKQHKSVLDVDYNKVGTTTEPGECSAAENAWYYMLPFILYVLLVLAALGLFLILVHVTLCLRKYLCPLIPLDVGLCHRTTVTEEKQPDCRKKDKLQLSLVNVNKHYYKLEGHDGP